MAFFQITLPGTAVGMLRNGVNTMIVSAANSAQAILAAKAKYTGFASDAAWAAATSTTLADVAANADDALVGWRFYILVTGGAAQTVDPLEINFTGDADDDTIDTIAAELVTLLNATADIANSEYNSTTQVLTISSIADGIGDASVFMEVYPPIELSGDGKRSNQDVAQTGFVTATTHEGVAAAVLTTTFAADTLVLPRVLATLKTV